MNDKKSSQNQRPAGARTFTLTLAVLLVLVVVYTGIHVVTHQYFRSLHAEGATVDAERVALLLGARELWGELSTPPAIAAPAVEAVLGSLAEATQVATSTETVTGLFGDAVQRLVNLGLAQDAKQPSRDSATARVTAFLAPALKQAEALVAAPESGREVPGRLLEVELGRAKEAVLDYMAAPALIVRVDGLKEEARGLGYGADSATLVALNRIGDELAKDRPNRALAAEMLSRVEEQVQGLRTALFWSQSALRWVEVVAWSLAGILVARLISAGRYIGLGQYKPEWDRWWWAKIVMAPIMAIPVVAFLTYLTIDVQSGETLGIAISLKDQPIEVVIAFAFIIGMFSDQAYKFLQSMANRLLPEDDETQGRRPVVLVTVEDTPSAGRHLEEVQPELEAKGFKVKVEMRETDQGEPGTVLERRPSDAKLKKGSEVTLVVAKAPPES